MGDEVAEDRDARSEVTEPEDDARRVHPVPATLAAATSSAAAAWMVSSLFADFSAHLVALLGVVIGSGLVYLSVRGTRQTYLQWLVIPLAAVVGIALVAPDAGGGSNGSVPGLIGEAVSHGALLQPPVSFDPGWRFLLVVIFALVGAASTGVGAVLGRPKLGVALPAPLLLGAGIIQPASTELVSAAVTVILLVPALTLAFNAELSRDGKLSASFEAPRMLRAGAIAMALTVALTGLSTLGFLFPQPQQQHVVPPMKPPTPPPQPDVPLFDVKMPRSVPLQLGVLSTYDPAQQAWLLPGYDVTRLQRVQPPATIAGAPANLPTITATITMLNPSGHALPTVAGAQRRVSGTTQTFDYDPLTASLSLADKPAYQGLTYTVEAVSTDQLTGKQLSGAPAPKGMAAYLIVPPAPNEVVTVLNNCATQMQKQGVNDLWNRLQCVRTQFYSKVTAVGSGQPVDVSAARVAQIINGSDATPYEIIASEALMARWAGVPAQIGYGYYGGVKQKDGAIEVHPVDGAMWLEAYFQGYGWVPLYGTPPKAKPSTTPSQKRQANITQDTNGQMLVYIPVAEPSPVGLFVFVRYWIFTVLPFVLVVVLLAVLHPWFFKLARSRIRRRWARRHGSSSRVAVAYTEMRDRARDLNIGDPGVTPLRFLGFVEADPEHRELAWLTTRALWGDLRRDLTDEDCEAAEMLAASVRRRLSRAAPVLDRVLGAIARSSLREPYSTQVPNPWIEIKLRIHPLRWLRARVRRRPAVRRRPVTAAAAAIAALLLAGCGSATASTVRPLDTKLVPASLGDYTFKREKAAESQFQQVGSAAFVSNGLLYSIHNQGATVGSLEVAVFKATIDVEDINNESVSGQCTQTPEDCPGHEVLLGMEANIGTGHFHRIYYRGERVYQALLPEGVIYVWFPPGKETLVLLNVVQPLASSGADVSMVEALIDSEMSKAPRSIPEPLYSSAATPQATGTPAAGQSSPPASASPQGA